MWPIINLLTLFGLFWLHFQFLQENYLNHTFQDSHNFERY